MKKKFLSSKLFLILISIFMLIVSVFLWKTQESRNLSQLKINVESKAISYANETEINYRSIYNSINRLANQRHPDQKSDDSLWEEDVEFYLENFVGLKKIALVDTSFRVEVIAPTEENSTYKNRKVNDLDFFSDEVSLLVPIYSETELNGFILGIIDIEDLMSPVLSKIDGEYMLSVWVDGKLAFNSQNWENPSEKWDFKQTIALQNTTALELSFSPTSSTIQKQKNNARQTLLSSLLFSAITLIAIYFAQKFSFLSNQNLQQYRNLFKASQDAIFTINTKGEYLDANQAALKMVGYSLQELKKLTINDIRYTDPPHYDETYKKWIDENPEMVLLQHKNGAAIPVDLVTSLVKENGVDQYVLGIARDISKRIQAEKEKKEFEAKLRQQQKLESIGTLASGVAHEINNPITGIMNYATLIHDRLDPKEERLKKFASEIIRETERVAKIVYNLLTFARQEKQTHSPARMSDIINDTLSLIQTIIRHDQITLNVDVPDDLPLIKCRSQQIQQVLMNLLTNARDALNERYPEYDPNKIINIKTHLYSKNGQDWLRTTVEDFGKGIPKEISDQIFDPFFTTKDRSKGTGLGLSISLGIVQDHKGELICECEENQYTRFHVDLPVDNGWILANQKQKNEF